MQKIQKNNLFKLIIAFAIISGSMLLFYIFFTGNIWEDFFITFRYSRNLIEGNGLVYNLGERVYGFTSPVGVLLLSTCYYITGKATYLFSIWLFRIISISFFTAAGILLLSTLFNKHKERILPVVLMAMLYLFDAKSVLFSINGMETAFMLFFLACYIYLNYNGLQKNWIASGFCWAGLLWTRPDACVYIIAFSIAHIVFCQRPRKEILAGLSKTTLVCAILYLPWFIWTWNYYGSPIPNTVRAKYYLIQHNMQYFLTVGLPVYQDIFGPIYYHKYWGWPGWLEIFSFSLWFFTFFYWVFPLKDKLGKIISFSLFIIYPYFIFIPKFPWYFPPVTMLSLFVLVNGLFTLLEQQKRKITGSKTFVAVFLSLVCLEMIYIFTMTAVEMRIQQKEIETGNRQQVGLWLKENAKPLDKVYLEPIGYIGYFSEAKISDYPGLVSLDLERLKKKGLDFYTSVPDIKPDWIILRPGEAEAISDSLFFSRNYNLVKTFSVIDRLSKYSFIPGLGYLLYDATFLIFKKK